MEALLSDGSVDPPPGSTTFTDLTIDVLTIICRHLMSKEDEYDEEGTVMWAAASCRTMFHAMLQSGSVKLSLDAGKADLNW